MNHQIGFIGLGRMGKNMVLHALEGGIDVVGYNRTAETTQQFSNTTIEQLHGRNGAGTFTPAQSIKELVDKLPGSRVVFLMLPARNASQSVAGGPNGKPVDDMVQQLLDAGITSGDTVIDGGNCYWKDSVRRAKDLDTKGIRFIDCGTSGGLEGARHGACLMLGGAEDTVQDLAWIWDALAVKDGYAYFGESGAGHFVKMVHNGVEYGMNQALGEGFEILSKGPYKLDLARVAQNWSHGSVVRGWLVELLAKALDADGKLEKFEGKVGGGQTGTWAAEEAKELGVDTSVLNDALKARESSQTKPTFAGKVVSALRAGYGGHREPGQENKQIDK